ncbi:MAG: hypothetical protein NC117_02860 [Pseudoflavonifractor sp.]|nr:hypothetical protein [Pseudoflavonifractor sp.]
MSQTFPELNMQWLMTGEGEMLNHPAEVVPVRQSEVATVPLYALESVAGFSGDTERQQYIEEMIPWVGARDGDFAVHVTGDSMEPRIPDGSTVLLRPYTYSDYTDLEFGRVHVVVTDDDRAMLKIIRLDRERPGGILLISINDEYPTKRLPVARIRRVFLAVSVQSPL